jgi:hypothetical protein
MEFEEIYASAGADLEAVPWASLAPHRELVAWLDEVPRLRGRDALVVGCGLGDDAEAVSPPRLSGHRLRHRADGHRDVPAALP